MGFETYHPAINLLYFAGTIAAAVLFRQPVYLAISYVCAFAYSVRRGGRRTLIFDLCLLPLILAFSLYYASYHHFGLTVLRQNFIGNSITLESWLYGLTLGVLCASVLMWLRCVLSVFTADKVVYLFGRVSPTLSLFLSILLRMLPRLKAQGKKVSTARRGIGLGAEQGTLFQRISHAAAIFSILLTWLLESLASTSDSMRSRGHSLRGRSAFSIYRFDNRDRSLVVLLFTCLTAMLMAHLLGQTVIRFDPCVVMSPITPASLLFYAAFALFCLLPLLLELWTQHRFQQARRSL